MANMMILFYLFCSGKLEDNLAGIFNLFDQDGNKVSWSAGLAIPILTPIFTEFEGKVIMCSLPEGYKAIVSSLTRSSPWTSCTR